MKHRMSIVGIISILLLGSFVLAQDINMEVVKEKYRIFPLFALKDNGEAVTDLKKADVEFLLNGQNSREFLLFKKAFSRSGSQDSANKIYSEAPGLKKDKVIILFFDTLFANKKTLKAFDDIARHIVSQTDDRVKYMVLNTESTSVAFSTTIPQKNKKKILRIIKNKAAAGPGYMYNPDVKIKRFAQSLEKLYQCLKKNNDNKIVYIFSPKIRQGDWQGYADLTSLYLERIDGVLVFIDPANATTGTGDDFSRSPAKRSGGKYLTGNKNTIIKHIDNLHRSYYEIIIPGLKEFKGSHRHIRISSTREHVTLHLTKEAAKIPGRPAAAGPASPQQPVPAAPGPQKGDRKIVIEVKDRTAANRPASAQQIAKVNKLLTSNRYDVDRATTQLLCEKALTYLKQGRLKDSLGQLHRILESKETRTGFIRQAAAELDKILEADSEVETLLKNVVRFRKQSHNGDMLHLHEKINVIIDNELSPVNGNDIVPLFKDLQIILTHVREETDFIRAELSQLSGYLSFDQKEVFYPYCSKAENYRHILKAAETVYPAADEKNDSRNRIRKIITHLKNAAAEADAHMDFIEYVFEKLKAVDRESCNIFVIRNNDQFALEYRKAFYRHKLVSLGADPALLTNPDFIDVLGHAVYFTKNGKGYWEGLFYNDTALIYIPAGKFTMGLPWETGGGQDESPRHEVFLSGYWIAKFETTFKQFDLFCESRKSGKPVDSDFGRKARPVINISWNDMDKYCKWLSEKTSLHFRLPTEAEWEKAARGAASWKYPWGNAKPDGQKANFADRTLSEYYKREHPGEVVKGKLGWMDENAEDGYRATAPVGKFPGGASPYGVMDMAGNVWEFTGDWYDGDYYQRSPAENPTGAVKTGYKTVRGGGWDSHHWMLRSTTRAGGVPGKTSDVVGFRVAASRQVL